MIDSAKQKAASANQTASNTMDRLNEIRKEINKIGVPSGSGNLSGILDDVDQTSEILSVMFLFPFSCALFFFPPPFTFLVFPVKNLQDTIPTLDRKLSAVENLTSQFSPISNISENIKNLKDLIEQARDAANRVRSYSVITAIHACPV